MKNVKGRWRLKFDILTLKFNLHRLLTSMTSNCSGEILKKWSWDNSVSPIEAKNSFSFLVHTAKSVASSRLVYYSILNSLGQRSQYISIKFPLHKQSENTWVCYWLIQSTAHDFTFLFVFCVLHKKEHQLTFRRVANPKLSTLEKVK